MPSSDASTMLLIGIALLATAARVMQACMKRGRVRAAREQHHAQHTAGRPLLDGLLQSRQAQLGAIFAATAAAAAAASWALPDALEDLLGAGASQGSVARAAFTALRWAVVVVLVRGMRRWVTTRVKPRAAAGS